MDRTQLARLVVFEAVADCGGFRAAAARLGVAPSAVSHAVSGLEASLGLRLLARNSRGVRPTEEGARLLERLSGPLAEIAAALAEASERGAEPSGPLRITLPLLAAEEAIMDRLPEFSARYPQVELELRVSDVFENLVESGFDAGVRLGESLEPDMIAVRISGPLRGVIAGSPSYFATRPKPEHPRDLAAHNCIRRRFESGRLYRWDLEKAGEALKLEVKGALILPNQDLIRRAALDGLGLAWLFESRIETDLREGRLIAVLEDWCAPFDGFYIYHPSRRLMRPALRAFIDVFRHRA